MSLLGLKLVRSISIKFLSIVLSIYLMLTLIVTAIHIYVEYRHAHEEVYTVFEASENTFKHILASDLLNLDYEQLSTKAKSIIGLPHITGIIITTDQNESIVNIGVTSNNKSQDNALISHTFPLTISVKGTITEIGKVTFYSNTNFIFNSIRQSIVMLCVNAAIKTAAVFLLISVAFKILLTTPLGQLAKQACEINPNNLDNSMISVAKNHKDELGILQSALNSMINKTSEAFASLDAQNKDLEKIVDKRTQELQESITDLNEQHAQLENEIEVRHQSELALAKSLTELKNTQSQLIESEKMAALGRLVAGVAHEINTPIGLSLTGISHFQITVKEVARLFDEGELEEDNFTRFINESQELSSTINNSLQRAADLIRSFKLVAVDQSAEEIRQFDIIQYLNETMISLRNKLKQSKVAFEINAKTAPLIINNYPGSWAQIFTNLIQNTLIHAYAPQSEGKVELNFYTEEDRLIFEFIDDGKGMTQETINKIFEPFYTTNRANGGSGLGMNVVFNIVRQKMHGTISVESDLDKGTKFIINVPIDIKVNSKGEDNGLI